MSDGKLIRTKTGILCTESWDPGYWDGCVRAEQMNWTHGSVFLKAQIQLTNH